MAPEGPTSAEPRAQRFRHSRRSFSNHNAEPSHPQAQWHCKDPGGAFVPASMIEPTSPLGPPLIYAFAFVLNNLPRITASLASIYAIPPEAPSPSPPSTAPRVLKSAFGGAEQLDIPECPPQAR
ncbi:hypothetical protein D9611_008321 [Ephemerocybe angulata]|uniref:Uncharacterized protein n=1 Tax=Ephemerocybe angulata TaxID=980116 RepID=A0A8H5F5J1_9AGAR|nr:hypothetical protein D9611_008321 [Tulosesus angulatus]